MCQHLHAPAMCVCVCVGVCGCVGCVCGWVVCGGSQHNMTELSIATNCSSFIMIFQLVSKLDNLNTNYRL